MASQKCIICIFQFIYFYFMSNVVNRVLLHYHEILIQKKNIHKRLEVFHLSFLLLLLLFFRFCFNRKTKHILLYIRMWLREKIGEFNSIEYC